jgi:hypothetical protein
LYIFILLDFSLKNGPDRCGGQAYRPSNWEAEEGGQQVQGQPELLNETLSQQTKNEDACVLLFKMEK